MMKKLMFLGAGAVGYVLGAKAGRERYDQIAEQARKLRNNPTVQDLFKKAKVEQDQTKRCDLYYQMQQLFNDDAVAILLYHTPFVTLVNNNVKDFYMTPLGWYVWKATWLNQ